MKTSLGLTGLVLFAIVYLSTEPCQASALPFKKTNKHLEDPAKLSRRVLPSVNPHPTSSRHSRAPHPAAHLAAEGETPKKPNGAQPKPSLTIGNNGEHQEEISWSRHVVLDKNAGSLVHLFWNADRNAGTATFEVQAQVTGWVGVGFSPSGGMAGADIVTCWVKDGVATLQDRHALTEGLPALDEIQDYSLLSAYENETHTVCRFMRKLDTCDLENDHLITSDTIKMIYAYGLTDPENEDPYYHGSNRGTLSVYLLDPPTGVTDPDPETTNIFDVRTPNATIPGDKETTYICSIHKGVSVDTKHQYIGYVPIIQPGHELYVHHALLYECYMENQEEIDAMEADVGRSAECYGSQMPNLWTRCSTTYIAWAVGSEGQMYPENVGYPIQTADEGPFFYMMEMHYNNPTFDTFVDNSGLRVYYTDVVRELDMGLLHLGLSVTPFQMIPPRVESFTSVAICPATCTEDGLPNEGVNVFAGLLHSHLLGRKMKLRLIRNGVEEPWFQYDDHYDFDFQEMRVYPEIKKILPGDILILECTMDSTKRDATTIGGWGTEEEMCLAFLSYYPRSTMTRCQNFFNYDVMQALTGFPDLIQDIDNLQFLVDEDTTFVEYLDETFAPWDDEEVQLLRDIASTKIPSLGYCVNEKMELIGDIVEVTYPDMVEYQPPPRNCSSPAPTGHVSKRRQNRHPGYQPVEMTKSLRFGFPQLALSGGHLYKKIKN